jgi:hypothetical protein
MDSDGRSRSPTGNVVPRKGLRVRAPCPPLSEKNHKQAENALFTGFSAFFVGARQRRKPAGPEGQSGPPRDTEEQFRMLTVMLVHLWGIR